MKTLKHALSTVLLSCCVAAQTLFGAREIVCNVSGNTGTTETGIITRICETAAITLRYALVQTGTAPGSQFIVNTALTRPMGVVMDEPAVGGDAAIQLLGVKPGTMKMVASGVITAGALVYTTAAGKVSATLVAGAFMVGRALTAAGADLDIIEVAHCAPIGTADMLAIGKPINYAAVTTMAGGVLAVPVTHRTVNKTITGTEALTLADGAFNGQRLRICIVAQSGGSATLTPTTASGWATIVFAIKGQQFDLEWTTAGWIITGFCYLTTLPVITVP